jgi:hypothetical protein
MANGDVLAIGEFTTATNTLRRLLADLGLSGRARPPKPTPEQYFKTRKAVLS